MNELPPDPPRLRAILRYLDEQVAATETVGVYLRLQRDAVRAALAASETPRRQPTPPPAAAKRPDEPAQPLTGYKLEPKKHPSSPQPAHIHVADCTMNNRRTSPLTADQARIALRDPAGLMEACEFCRPDTELGLLD